jgi:glycerol-3-phosphate acyltransferase PlsX
LLAAGLFRLGRIPGVDRPAILTSFPRVDRKDGELASREGETEVGKFDRTVLLDAGANVECRPLNLVQFAVMGAVHARVEQGRERPTVAVLANGSEAGKGTALTRASCELLESHPSELFEFLGLAEPAELFASRCDVVVTDGWTGNLMLKLGERAMTACFDLLRESLRGASQSAEIEGALAATQTRVDPELHGGAPLFGVDGTLIICHGSSTPRALLNALTHARRFADRGLHSALTEALASHQALFDSARAKR